MSCNTNVLVEDGVGKLSIGFIAELLRGLVVGRVAVLVDAHITKRAGSAQRNEAIAMFVHALQQNIKC